MTYVLPTLVSEREAAPHTWPDGEVDPAGAEDCVFCSVLMGLNGATPGKHPATLAEAERLRRAAGYGPTGGATIERAIAATTKLYGIAAAPIVGASFTELWAALMIGRGAAIIGRPANLPAGHVVRRYLPDFTALHATYVQRRTYRERVDWFDPMAPQGGPYSIVSKADLATFYTGSAAIFSIAKAA